MMDKCPECNYLIKNDFKVKGFCKYCSMAYAQKYILDHNYSNCKHSTDYESDEWNRGDCEMLWESYEQYYDDIVGEVF